MLKDVSGVLYLRIYAFHLRNALLVDVSYRAQKRHLSTLTSQAGLQKEELTPNIQLTMIEQELFK